MDPCLQQHAHECHDCRCTFTCPHRGAYYEILPCDGCAVFFCIACAKVRGLDFDVSVGAKASGDIHASTAYLEVHRHDAEEGISFEQ